MYRAIETIFTHRQKFIILGLTGKIGAGCTSVANFLTQSTKEHFLSKVSLAEDSPDSLRKKHIIDKFYRENWKPFIKITASDAIATFIMENEFDKINHYLKKEHNMELPKKIKKHYNQLHNKTIKVLAKINSKDYDKDVYKFIIEELPLSIKVIKKSLQKNNYRSYTKVFQTIGDNIRKTGTFDGQGSLKASNIYLISERINSFIKVLRSFNKENTRETFIVIDAFRNPFEVMFFKERYSAFYLLSINSKEEDIHDRLIKNLGMTEKEIRKQNEKENPGDSLKSYDTFISQNIQECIQKSDIHISNNGKVSDSSSLAELHGQIIKYVSLIQHPGLITPSNDEKMMQVAYTAKLNSGCISRQVGATVTNEYGSVVSIGWNSVAEGQTPCLLRDEKELLQGSLSLAYSPYEQTTKFKKSIKKFSPLLSKKKLRGRNQSFCFKSIYNQFEKVKNQVHTRSLHAEENAFLQVAKYGGVGVDRGVLYSTASPCELCSKKAYQLGIKRIVYIDPYPGIAKKQILLAGKIPPELNLFKGAVGVAYHKIYDPILSYKDELEALSNDR